MIEREHVGGLQVAKVLYDFVQNEALPGTGVDPAQFWSGAEGVITDLAPRNKALLAVRDEIQGKVDAWHGEHAGPDYDKAAYKAFLKEIGYLLDEPADFSITTAGVDTEITSTAGPQLVVPVLNARFAINASNWTWAELWSFGRTLGLALRRPLRHRRRSCWSTTDCTSRSRSIPRARSARPTRPGSRKSGAGHRRSCSLASAAARYAETRVRIGECGPCGMKFGLAGCSRRARRR